MQYFNQEVLVMQHISSDLTELEDESIYQVDPSKTRFIWDYRFKLFLRLKKLSTITLDEALSCLKIFGKYRKDINYKIKYKVGNHGNQFAQIYYDVKVNEPDIPLIFTPAGFYDDYQVVMNIGDDFHSVECSRGLTYLQVYQFLQQCGFALPYHDMSIEKLLNIGWLEFSKNSIVYERI